MTQILPFNLNELVRLGRADNKPLYILMFLIITSLCNAVIADDRNMSAASAESQYSGTGNSPDTIPLTLSKSGDYYTYSINLSDHSGAINTTYPIRLDSGSTILTVPKSIVDQSKINILVKGTTDGWGNPADLVQGVISLGPSRQGEYYTTSDNFTFFQNYHTFALMGVQPVYEMMPDGTRIKGQPWNNYCIGNVFLDFNYPSHVKPGFAIINSSGHALPPNSIQNFDPSYQASIQVGLSTSSQISWWQYAPYPPGQQCVNNKPYHRFVQYPGYGDLKDYLITTLPSVSVAVNASSDPDSQRITLPAMQLSLDTGAPLFTIRDDNKNTIGNKFNSQLEPCPPSWTWLHHCVCFKPGVVFDVNFNLNGSSSAYSFERDANYDVVLCANNSPGPFADASVGNAGAIFYFGVNGEYFDIAGGRVGINAPSDTRIPSDTLFFGYSGEDQFFTVPSGVTSAVVQLWGAGGGGSGNSNGGAGGYVRATLAVSAGQAYKVIVGGGGDIASSNSPGYGGQTAIQKATAGADLVTAGGGEAANSGGSGSHSACAVQAPITACNKIIDSNGPNISPNTTSEPNVSTLAISGIAEGWNKNLFPGIANPRGGNGLVIVTFQ